MNEMSGLMNCYWCNNTESHCKIIRTIHPVFGVDQVCENCIKPKPAKITLKEDFDKVNGIPTDTFIV